MKVLHRRLLTYDNAHNGTSAKTPSRNITCVDQAIIMYQDGPYHSEMSEMYSCSLLSIYLCFSGVVRMI